MKFSPCLILLAHTLLLWTSELWALWESQASRTFTDSPTPWLQAFSLELCIRFLATLILRHLNLDSASVAGLLGLQTTYGTYHGTSPCLQPYMPMSLISPSRQSLSWGGDIVKWSRPLCSLDPLH